MSESDKNFDIFAFLRSILTFSNRSRQSLLDYEFNSDTKPIQKVHNLQEIENFEIFRQLLSHSEVFLKRNAATFASNNVMHSSLSRC